jgi:hypothetical protein
MGNGVAEDSEQVVTDDGFNILYHKVKERFIEKAWVRLEKAGLEPILIKGWAAARFYPKPFLRPFIDIDLLIAPEQFERAKRLFENTKQDFSIDFHKGARHLDTVSFENLFANSRIVRCGETAIRVLRPEDHLRVLCVHWLNDGGAYREKLWDVYYAVANRSTDFDWERCLGTVSAKRRCWIVCTIGLAHKYLGLEIEDTPFADEAKEIPVWVIKTVESEWASETNLLPLISVINDRDMFFKQVRKRLPPNPIQATVEMEGDFDNKPRFIYQIPDVFFRLASSIKRFSKTFLQ